MKDADIYKTFSIIIHLGGITNDFNIEKIESNMNIISQCRTEWSLRDNYIYVCWKYKYIYYFIYNFLYIIYLLKKLL